MEKYLGLYAAMYKVPAYKSQMYYRLYQYTSYGLESKKILQYINKRKKRSEHKPIPVPILGACKHQCKYEIV